MTRFVLDCSVAMGWCFEDEADTYARNVLESLAYSAAIVPALWPLEVATVLTAYLRLALQEGLPLATRDRGLRTAARAAGVPVFAPTAA
jgi:rRNA-processing protein FCF1